MPNKIRTGLFINQSKEQIVKYSYYLIDLLNSENIDTWIVGKRIQDGPTDFLIILGGDGTILQAFQQCGCNIPFLCINFGKIGFLSSVDPEQFPGYTKRLKEGIYCLEERSVLEFIVHKGTAPPVRYYALNEIAIRADRIKASHQLISIDGRDCFYTEGDGIIASTSTGSTAYSRSAGGPIVEPIIDGLVLTPICSRNLSSGSLVLGSNRQVTVKCQDFETNTSITVDGISRDDLSYGDQVDIRLSTHKAKFVTFEKDRYLNLLCSTILKDANTPRFFKPCFADAAKQETQVDNSAKYTFRS